MKKLIIFDCDGVLVDSEAITNRIDAEILTSIGYPITEEENIQKFTGLCYQKIKQIIHKEKNIEITDEFIDEIQNKIMKVFETDLKPLMLPILSNDLLKNTEKCVASSSPRDRILFSLQVTGLLPYFKDEHIFTASEVKNTKPAPDLFLLAAKKMGYHPKDCLVIEDSVAGIQAAIAAEMHVIGFLGGGHAGYDWYKEKIKKQNIPIAHNVSELLSIINHFAIDARENVNLQLSPRDQQLFTHSLLNPAQPSAKLLKAVKRHRKIS